MTVIPTKWTPADRDGKRKERNGRIPLEVPVELRSWEGPQAGITKNLSAGGVFVATLRTLAVGHHVTVRLTIPDYTEPVDALAEVRWVRSFQELDDWPPGLGLRFIDTPLRAAILMWELRLSRLPRRP